MQLNIIKNRMIFFITSGVFAVFSIGVILFGNLNLGIDMTGGSQSEFSYTSYELDIERVAQEAQTIKDHINLSGDIINSVNVYKITGEKTFIVESGFRNTLPEKEIETYKVAYRDQLQAYYADMGDITLSKYTNIGASFGDYIKSSAIKTLIIAMLLIAVYIAYTFSGTVGGISSLSFALITLISLFHDVLISGGLYIVMGEIFPQFQIDTFFVTALLTILGYSINDTIVIFDRIRSNLREFGGKGRDLGDIINTSINETMTRSIYTSLTLAFVLICIIVFGPNSITGFTLTMLFGTIIGTFSSIFIASPLLYEFHKNTVLTVYKKKEERTNEDKMVV